MTTEANGISYLEGTDLHGGASSENDITASFRLYRTAKGWEDSTGRLWAPMPYESRVDRDWRAHLEGKK